MKYFFYAFAIFSIFFFVIFEGCCLSSEGANNLSPTDSITFRFKDNLIITKIELIGVNKSINVDKNQFTVTFNPIDSISSFRVYNYSRSGEIFIRNNKLIKTDDRPCASFKYTITYAPELIRTTFNKASLKINENDNKKHDVEIEL